jgi:hypothetical protein
MRQTLVRGVVGVALLQAACSGLSLSTRCCHYLALHPMLQDTHFYVPKKGFVQLCLLLRLVQVFAYVRVSGHC